MKIALVMSTDNPEPKYIQKAFDSVIGFNEYILHVNEGSELPKDLKLPYGTVVYHDRNLVSAADGFNKAIELSSSDWILPFCDDDEFIKTNLLQLLDYTDRNPRLDDADVIHYPCLINGKQLWGDKFVTFKDLREQNCIPFSCLYKKKVWDTVKGYQNLPFNDWFFWLCAMKKNFRFLYYDRPIYNFRQEGNSLSDREYKSNSFQDIRKTLLERLETF